MEEGVGGEKGERAKKWRKRKRSEARINELDNIRKGLQKWSNWEVRMEMEEQKRREEWKDEEQKRKDKVEENWRSELEEKMKMGE